MAEYIRADVVTFRKTRDPHGALSNMASGHPITIGDKTWRTSEALYQAARFPYNPEIQEKILLEKSPMMAKRVTMPYRKEHSREDWFDIGVEVMRYAIRAKLYSSKLFYYELLVETDGKVIVEDSWKDAFWGAVPTEDNTKLIGENVLGLLLMELREQLQDGTINLSRPLLPPAIPDFLYFGELLEPLECSWNKAVYAL